MKRTWIAAGIAVVATSAGAAFFAARAVGHNRASAERGRYRREASWDATTATHPSSIRSNT